MSATEFDLRPAASTWTPTSPDSPAGTSTAIAASVQIAAVPGWVAKYTWPTTSHGASSSSSGFWQKWSPRNVTIAPVAA